MSLRILGASVTAAMLFAAAPASAQQFSDSYNFLEAVRKEDGSKVTQMVTDSKSRIVNTKNRDGDGALHIIVRKGDEQSAVYLRFLLQHDANPDLPDRDGNTPMMVAINSGYAEGVKILLTYKAKVNQRNAKGETPLIRAVQLRDQDLVHVLLDAGADPDQADVIAGMSARDYAKADRRMPGSIKKALEDAPKVDKKTSIGPKL